MNPEYPHAAPENPETEPLDSSMLSSLEQGHWNERLTDPWLREHTQNPTVRLAVISGIFVNTGTFDYGGDERVRGILGLTDDEFRTPAAKKRAAMTLSLRLAAGTLRGVQDVERLARLGPDYFSAPETLRRLESAVANMPDFSNRFHSLSELAVLPIPAEFFLRPAVRKASNDVITETVLEGNEEAIDLAPTYGIGPDRFKEIFRAPNARVAAIRIASQCVETGSYERYRKWADLFGIDDGLIPEEPILSGYCAILERGELDEARAFANRFPQGDRVPFAEGKGLYAMRGTRSLIVAGRLDAAWRLASSENLASALRDNAIELAIQQLLMDGNAETLKRLRTDWSLADSAFQNGAERAIEKIFSDDEFPNAWETAMRARKFSGLPEDRFERAILEGQGMMISNRLRASLHRDYESLHYEYARFAENFPAELKFLKEMRGRLPVDAGLAARMERSNAVAVITFLLGEDMADLADAVRREFPSVDDAAVRDVALGIAKAGLMGNLERGGETKMGRLNGYLRERNIPALTWEDLRQEATESAKRRLMAYDPEGFVTLTRRHLWAPVAECEAILNETREDVLSGAFDDELDPDLLAQILEVYGLSWETVPLRLVPIRFLLDSDNETLCERRKNDPWNDAIAALLKLQGRTANEKHDPWVNELSPLVDDLSRFGTVLNRESPEDGALLVEYVKTFGMLNLSNVSSVFLRLSRKPFADLGESDRQVIVEAVGRKAARMESKQIINELRLLRFGLQGALLRDEIHPRLMTTIGSEIFMALRGSTQWGRDDDTGEIMDTWKATVAAARAEGRNEDVSVAPGYEETTFAVARAYRSKDGSGSAEEEIGNLVRRAEETVENDDGEGGTYETAELLPLGMALDKFSHAAQIAQETAADSETGKWTFQNLNRLFDSTALPDEAAFESLFRGRGDQSFVAEMGRALTAYDAGRILRYLSAIHIAKIAPGQWVDHMSKTKFRNAEDEVRHRAEFVSQYLREHYLNPGQDPAHTGHPPFFEPLRIALEHAWDVGNDGSENVILTTAARVEKIRARQKLVSKDTVAVTLVPTQGPLRIFAGDLGDACYSSQHAALAEGMYPRLKAMAFVTNRGKGTERMVGSVLLVETRLAESDERAIVVRANNPRENLIAALDAPSLVRQTIDAAIATARRRKIKHVGVVRGQASAACSNRDDVAAFYQEEYRHNATARLANEPETNFNGYDIWNEAGEDPTVIVWTNEDPEAT